MNISPNAWGPDAPLSPDPLADLLGDPAFVEARFAELMRAYEAGECDDLDCFREPFPPAVEQELLDHDPVAELVRRSRALVAEQDRTFNDLLVDAAADPDPWVGADPTHDPLWQDPRGRSAATVRAERRDFAIRAAAADLAVRVQLSEQAVRGRAHRAGVLRQRMPRLWAAYTAGDVSEQNAASAASLADSLPADAAGAWEAFDDAITDAATRLAPGRFRTRARAARERIHAESLDVRHERAAADRDIFVTPDLDGMATLSAFLPAASVRMIEEELDERARALHSAPDETRTLAQLRADAFVDLLTGTDSDPTRSRATVFLTIPALSLLGQGDEPAMLDGYGPIPLDDARRLAGDATQWIRVLTDPITGTMLDVERTTYRVPKSLRRWLAVRRGTCIFPGCGRSAHRCDIDHRIRWTDGGHTSAHNNDPVCEPHHRVKEETLWALDRDPATDDPVWTSPTGFRCTADPPPF
ncbi:DUF222 domain-containing protein [Microbacterium sp. bgisy189]|uniref:HNH endonuclease signature motif containing protein n=1 Tax=Microbacterium sp. bgisy189 TaxID=3413798 RepID=UPI003EBCB471